MTTVLTFGVWDLLHVGHVAFLVRAAALGDRLVVGVAGDEAVRQDKGRPPVIPDLDRAKMIGALRCVESAVVYPELDFLPTLWAVKPDVLAVGSQWGGQDRHRAAEAWMNHYNKRVSVIFRTSGVSTTDIVARIREGK
jgi:glycerol-3-phosphate cytidylyltransferase